MRYQVVISRDAVRSIFDQARYIANEGQSPQNAGQWLDSVFAAVDSLEQFPRRCPVAPSYRAEEAEVRVLTVSGFVLYFVVDDGAAIVQVLSARHGRQAGPADRSNGGERL